jgi:hypothetical protein
MKMLLVGLARTGIHYAQIKDIAWYGKILESRRGWLVRRVGGQQQNRDKDWSITLWEYVIAVSDKVEQSSQRSIDI